MRKPLLCAARTCAMAVLIGEIVNGSKTGMDARLVRSSSRNEVGVATAAIPFS